MHKLTSLLFFMIASGSLLAQGRYQEGYIINNENDTLKGLIKSGSLAKEYISLKQPGNRAAHLYPMQVKSYSLNDRHFISAAVPVKGELSKYLFVEQLVSGKISLFAHGNSLMIRREGDEELQVINRFYNIELPNGDTEMANDPRYYRTLKFLTDDCDKVKKDLQKIKYTKKYLIDLVVKYNQCNEN